MKIIPAVADQKGRTVAVVSDCLEALSMVDAVARAGQHLVDDFHVVHRGGREFLRKNRGVRVGSTLDAMTISFAALSVASKDFSVLASLPAARIFCRAHRDTIRARVERGESPIVIGGVEVSTKEYVRATLLPHRDLVFEASGYFSIDPYLFGGILVDEIARLDPLEDFGEIFKLLLQKKDVSVGVAQVMLETARDIIRAGYYNPNPGDALLDSAHIGSVSREHLYPYAVNPMHSIFLGAARIRQTIDHWRIKVGKDIDPDIIATLYSIGLGSPKENPQTSSRGAQIVNEFMSFVKEILDGV